jgi:hypothetical protein
MLTYHYIIPSVCLVQWPDDGLIQAETWSQAYEREYKLRFDWWLTFFYSKDIIFTDCTDGSLLIVLTAVYWLYWRQFTDCTEDSLLPYILYHNFMNPPPPYLWHWHSPITQPCVLTPLGQNLAIGHDPKPVPSEWHSYKLFLHRLFRYYKRACTVFCPRNCELESGMFRASSCLSTSWTEVLYSGKCR